MAEASSLQDAHTAPRRASRSGRTWRSWVSGGRAARCARRAQRAGPAAPRAAPRSSRRRRHVSVPTLRRRGQDGKDRAPTPPPHARAARSQPRHLPPAKNTPSLESKQHPPTQQNNPQTPETPRRGAQRPRRGAAAGAPGAEGRGFRGRARGGGRVPHGVPLQKGPRPGPLHGWVGALGAVFGGFFCGWMGFGGVFGCRTE